MKAMRRLVRITVIVLLLLIMLYSTAAQAPTITGYVSGMVGLCINHMPILSPTPEVLHATA